jgi:hypothetical protein
MRVDVVIRITAPDLKIDEAYALVEAPPFGLEPKTCEVVDQAFVSLQLLATLLRPGERPVDSFHAFLFHGVFSLATRSGW